MRFATTLACVVLIPVAAVAGYLANTDPKPPVPTVAAATAALGYKLNVNAPSDEVFYIVTKGKYKGQSAAAEYTLGLDNPPGHYVRVRCTQKSDNVNPLLGSGMVGRCKINRVSAKKALELVAQKVSPGGRSALTE